MIILGVFLREPVTATRENKDEPRLRNVFISTESC